MGGGEKKLVFTFNGENTAMVFKVGCLGVFGLNAERNNKMADEERP
jgi:hypothetical protein